jgi:FtsZ-binding cell division protein ZapB
LNSRNGELIAGTEVSNKHNAELKSANAASCKRIEELSTGIEALKRQNNQYVADIAGLNRRVEELAHNNELLYGRFNGATNEITTLRGQLEQETQLRVTSTVAVMLRSRVRDSFAVQQCWPITNPGAFVGHPNVHIWKQTVETVYGSECTIL